MLIIKSPNTPSPKPGTLHLIPKIPKERGDNAQEPGSRLSTDSSRAKAMRGGIRFSG